MIERRKFVGLCGVRVGALAIGVRPIMHTPAERARRQLADFKRGFQEAFVSWPRAFGVLEDHDGPEMGVVDLKGRGTLYASFPLESHYTCVTPAETSDYTVSQYYAATDVLVQVQETSRRYSIERDMIRVGRNAGRELVYSVREMAAFQRSLHGDDCTIGLAYVGEPVIEMVRPPRRRSYVRVAVLFNVGGGSEA